MDGPSSHRRTRPKHQIAALESRFSQLQQQLAQLEQAHDNLAMKSFVLHHLCDALVHLQLSSSTQQQQQDQQQQQVQQQQNQQQDQQQQQQPQSAPADAEFLNRQQEVLTELLEAEGSLLQQLGSLPPVDVGRPQQLLRAASTAASLPTIAPADDPMALFRRLTSQPALPGARSLTSKDLIVRFKDAVQQMSIQLHLLDAGLDPQQACAEMRAVTERFMHMLTSCALAGSLHVILEYRMCNAATLQLNPQAQAEQEGVVRAAVSKLGLTPAQQEVIALTLPVWLRLEEPASQEFHQLQQQIACDTADSGSPSAPGSGAGLQDPISHRQEQLQAAQQRLERLQNVTNKLSILSMAHVAWVIGRLTWAQHARLVVLTWPYPLSYLLAGQIIAQMWRQQQQQQQQQSSQEQSSPAQLLL